MESAIVRSVSDIEALATVNEIEELRIEASDLRDLQGLECITRVGNLYIERNPELESLDGLEGLVETVGPYELVGNGLYGEFFIRDNSALTEIAGFESLTEIDGVLEISGNSNLAEIRGFENVRLVRAQFVIADNPRLEDISGFAKFEGGNVLAEGEGGRLAIERNPQLRQVSLGDGVPALAIAQLEIRDNPELTLLDVRLLCTPGVYAFERNAILARLPPSVRPPPIDSDLCGYDRSLYWYTIRAMPQLVDLADLPHLEQASLVEIVDNGALRDLTGLGGVVAISELRVSDNPALVTLGALDPMAAGSLTWTETISVRNNAALDTCQVDHLVDQLLLTNADLEIDNGGNGDACQ